uniref:Uncharacterized protein n=1 Tax=Capra hircus TaxID=9925 RepID=A0A8C2XWA1_CAPHI
SIAVHGLSLTVMRRLLTAVTSLEQAQATDWRATLQTNQKGIHKTDKRLNAILDFLGGDGSKPFPCYDDKSSPPNGYGSSLFCVQY